MQGISKKQQKNEKNRALCRACAHGKGHLVTLPCAHARQRGHVAAACRPGRSWGVCCKALCRARWRTAKRAHGTEQPHGNVCAHGKVLAARQRTRARQSIQRTATQCRTAQTLAHGRELSARQRALPCKTSTRTATLALPSLPLPGKLYRAHAHGKAFAVRIGVFAVQSGARQRPVLP
jgi:hypothetical protein